MKVTVVFANTHRNRMALIHEGERFPYQYRTVQIELTPEQQAMLKPEEVGSERGQPVYEEIYNSWLEIETAESLIEVPE